MSDSFGTVLRRYRINAGLTQSALAERAGISEQAISTLERGARHRPRSDTLNRLASALDLDDAGAAFLARAVPARGPRAASVGSPSNVPSAIARELPARIADFAGRRTETDTVKRLTENWLGTSVGAPLLVAITGMGGIGKTTLAIEIAQQVSANFPDGQLFLNLGGFGPAEPMTPVHAVEYLLTSLGVPRSEIPTEADRAAALYRTLIAGRHVIVVLDNAADALQVAPLVPMAESIVILTSRRSLAALPGVHQIELSGFTQAESLELLTTMVGADRLTANEDATKAVLEHCGGLPLAVRIAGARLLARPQWPIDHLRDRLSHERRRLEELRSNDLSVRAAFAVSLHQLGNSHDYLDRAAAAAFPVLGILDSTDICLLVAASALDVPEDRADMVMERLVDAHLLETTEPGRYRFHDLVRSYARSEADRLLPVSHRADVLGRVLHLFCTIGWRAYADTNPGNCRSDWAPATATPATAATAPAEQNWIAWLEAERVNLGALVRQASAVVPDRAELLTGAVTGLLGYQLHHHHWDEWAALIDTVARLTTVQRDRVLTARLLHDLAITEAELGRPTAATVDFQSSLLVFEAAGDDAGTVNAACSLAHVLEHLGDFGAAEAMCIKALAACTHIAAPANEAIAYLTLAMISSRKGAVGPEVACLERSTQIYSTLGNRHAIARNLLNIGVARIGSGRLAEAIDALHRSIALAHEIGHALGESEALLTLATVHMQSGEAADALGCLERVLAIDRLHGYKGHEATAHHRMGQLLSSIGRGDEAADQWRCAAELYQQVGMAAADEVRVLLAGVS